jgi:DNA-binding LytR/AlgR family response regulator
MSLFSLSKMEGLLPAERFMRVHRSFVVNLKQVTTIERNRIVFNGREYIPIGDAYKEAFRTFIGRNFI